jgi:hypothetical protein
MASKGLETMKRPRYLTDVFTLGSDLIAGLTNTLVYIPADGAVSTGLWFTEAGELDSLHF